MSQHDKDNLVFLLNLSHDALHQWFYQASDDDIIYAEELIAQAHIMAIDARVAQLPQFKEAQEVLKPFLL
jgi:hypothetical protein